MLNLSFNTYPWANFIPGGGERQLVQYMNALQEKNKSFPKLNVSLFNQWEPKFHSINLMHYFGCMQSSLDFLIQVKKTYDIPIVISPNFWPEPDEWKDSGVLKPIKDILWLVDLIIVNSFIEEEALVRLLNIDSSKIAIVPNVVEDIFFEEVSPILFREKFNISGPFVLNVGNLEVRKNQFAFIQALKQFPDLTFVIIGNIRDAWFADSCILEGGFRVKVLPALLHGSALLRSAMVGCEFFAMPSLRETPSIASLEAAALGAKILTTNLGSTTEYFRDLVTYVNPYDPKSIVNGIELIRSKEVSPVLKEHIRKNYNKDVAGRALIDAYSTIVNF